MMCSNCNEYMPPVFEELNRDGSINEQRDNALEVTLSGGYSMFVDDWERGPLKLIICHDCSVKLSELFPVVALWANNGHPHPSDDEDCCELAWRHSDYDDMAT